MTSEFQSLGTEVFAEILCTKFQASMCLVMFLVEIFDLKSNTTVLETSLFGYHDFLTVELELPQNTKYSAVVRLLPSAEYSSVYETYFSK